MSHATFANTESTRPTTDFSRSADRVRLSPAAFGAFLVLSRTWRLSGQRAASLLGVSLSTWERLKARGETADLSQDQLTRVSALLGIYKGLHLLFADDMADRWPNLANSGPMFNRSTPIEAMAAGGIPLMLDVRRYVDATRGGL